jgi:hypothetical protein
MKGATRSAIEGYPPPKLRPEVWQDQSAHADADRAAVAQTPEYKALICFQDANLEYVRTHRPLPDADTQRATLAAMKAKCRADLGLPATPP